MTITIDGVDGIGEIQPGDDLAQIIAAKAPWLRDGDILVVTSKIVSKAEDRFTDADREDAIDAETVDVVARKGRTRIVRNALGLVLAAAGVDTSNVPGGRSLLLPKDPDASARRLRADIRVHLGVDVAIVITDTMGRAWRTGQLDTAIGLAGLPAIRDLRGTTMARRSTSPCRRSPTNSPAPETWSNPRRPGYRSRSCGDSISHPVKTAPALRR